METRFGKNVEEAISALTQKPMLATSAERFLILNRLKSCYKELLQPLRFSKILSEMLSEVSTPLEPYDLVAGRCVDRELTQEEECAFQAYLKHPDYPSNSFFLSSGHCSYSWDLLLSKGLTGLRADAVCRKDSLKSEEKRVFLSAVIEVYDAVIAYLLRYADAAQARGMTELECNLRKIATQAPDDFPSALQLLWTVTLINCAYITENPTLTVGRMDQLLYPYYIADLQSGRITRERAKEYVTDYYCKHNLIMGRGEHQVGDESNSTTFKRICNFDAPQYLLLAGTDEQGALAVNDLTELFAECIVPSFKNPVVVVRYVKDMDSTCPRLWSTLVEKALASASLMFYNDGNVLSTFARMGIPEEDARRYIHFGCNWASLGDRSAWMSSSPRSTKYNAYESEEERCALDIPYMRMNTEHGWPEDLMIVLHELAEKAPEEVTIDSCYEGFFARMEDFIDRKLAYLSRELEVRKRRPSSLLTFGDCFFAESIQNAECFSAGATYHFQIQAFQMFATVADSFIAVDQLVMKEKKLTLKDLLAAVDADFKGYESVLTLCRNADKYGMDTPLSNYHAKRLSHTASSLVIKKNRPYFEKERLFLTPCMQSDTWHLKCGITYGATPDGRLANTPFSQNARPSNGAAKNGLTAMFNSMLHLPSDGLLSGALNLDVNPNDFAGEHGKDLFASLLATYFNLGGLHAQVTAVSATDLIDAQKNPHLHSNLRVRVTGYSGVFVDISKPLQDDIIERLK
ncbi:MAG: hypothetical protein IJF33_00835 [Clostridia bacterium]|nr:hypothetical protein [Clostridia bacterium]